MILVVGLGYLVLSRLAPTRPHDVAGAQPSRSALPPQDVLPVVAGASPCTVLRVRAALENAEGERRGLRHIRKCSSNIGVECGAGSSDRCEGKRLAIILRHGDQITEVDDAVIKLLPHHLAAPIDFHEAGLHQAIDVWVQAA